MTEMTVDEAGIILRNRVERWHKVYGFLNDKIEITALETVLDELVRLRNEQRGVKNG